jgi:hypothetical protein
VPTYMVMDETGAEGTCCCVDLIDPTCRTEFYPSAAGGIPSRLLFKDNQGGPFGTTTDPDPPECPPATAGQRCTVDGWILRFFDTAFSCDPSTGLEPYDSRCCAECGWSGPFDGTGAPIYWPFKLYNAFTATCSDHFRVVGVAVYPSCAPGGGAFVTRTFRMLFVNGAAATSSSEIPPWDPAFTGTRAPAYALYECATDPADWNGADDLLFEKVWSEDENPGGGFPLCMSWPASFTVGP